VIDSPADTLRVGGAIIYIKIIETMIDKEKGVLKKPIVAIWNTVHKINNHMEVDGGWHW
jgi:hypothetical protein